MPIEAVLDLFYGVGDALDITIPRQNDKRGIGLALRGRSNVFIQEDRWRWFLLMG
jgi:hypothetical protein